MALKHKKNPQKHFYKVNISFQTKATVGYILKATFLGHAVHDSVVGRWKKRNSPKKKSMAGELDRKEMKAGQVASS